MQYNHNHSHNNNHNINNGSVNVSPSVKAYMDSEEQYYQQKEFKIFRN